MLGQIEINTIVQGIAADVNVREMFSGPATSKHLFRKVDCPEGTFVYAIGQVKDNDIIPFESSAEMIFFRARREKAYRSEGFGGSTLSFVIDPGDGSQDYYDLDLQGPWHSNAEALYQRTGVDLRDKYRTWCVVLDGFGKLLHKDTELCLGAFDRPDEIAKKCAEKHQCAVWVHSITAGGSSFNRVEANHD